MTTTTTKKITAEQLQRFIKKIIKEQMEEIKTKTSLPKLALKQKQIVALFKEKAAQTSWKTIKGVAAPGVVPIISFKKNGLTIDLYLEEPDMDLWVGYDMGMMSGTDPLLTKSDVIYALKMFKNT